MNELAVDTRRNSFHSDFKERTSPKKEGDTGTRSVKQGGNVSRQMSVHDTDQPVAGEVSLCRRAVRYGGQVASHLSKFDRFMLTTINGLSLAAAIGLPFLVPDSENGEMSIGAQVGLIALVFDFMANLVIVIPAMVSADEESYKADKSRTRDAELVGDVSKKLSDNIQKRLSAFPEVKDLLLNRIIDHSTGKPRDEFAKGVLSVLHHKDFTIFNSMISEGVTAGPSGSSLNENTVLKDLLIDVFSNAHGGGKCVGNKPSDDATQLIITDSRRERLKPEKEKLDTIVEEVALLDRETISTRQAVVSFINMNIDDIPLLFIDNSDDEVEEARNAKGKALLHKPDKTNDVDPTAVEEKPFVAGSVSGDMLLAADPLPFTIVEMSYP
ncbi:hypothetical protein [Endozoicomonas sp.]|uniref:hypothetical protein n=1 Tax=Endozoicomonas sp. TaxID=1892382 RepID=UPI00383BE9B5